MTLGDVGLTEDGALRLVVPLPPAALSPNSDSRHMRWVQGPARKEYRAAVKLLAASARNKTGWAAPQMARVSLVFLVARGRVSDGFYRPQDPWNAIAAFKSAGDGIVDAGLIVDDDALHLELGSLRIVKNLGPGISVIVERIG